MNEIEKFRERRQIRLDLFREEDHPRAKDGKFTKGAGQNNGGTAEPNGSPSKGKYSETVHREMHISKDDKRIIKDEEGKPPYINGVVASSALVDKGFSDGVSDGVKAEYGKAVKSEQEITGALMDCADQLGGSLYGIEFCLKAPSSVEEKIPRMIEKYRNKKGMEITQEQAVAYMDDLNRYTFMVRDHENMVESVLKVERQMKEKGFRQIERDNKYAKDDPDYKDIKLVFADRNGRPFEVQVHSEDSMSVKNRNHDLYETQRNVNTPAERKVELSNQMKENTRGLKNPKGIEMLESFKN